MDEEGLNTICISYNQCVGMLDIVDDVLMECHCKFGWDTRLLECTMPDYLDVPCPAVDPADELAYADCLSCIDIMPLGTLPGPLCSRCSNGTLVRGECITSS